MKNGDHYNTLVPHMNRNNSVRISTTLLDDTGQKPNIGDMQCHNVQIDNDIRGSFKQQKNTAHKKFIPSAKYHSGFKIAHLNTCSLVCITSMMKLCCSLLSLK